MIQVKTALIVCFAVATLRGQTGTGTIQGTVKDGSGAVVPGAKVTATQTQTSRAYATTTNEVGFYLIPSVQIGLYELRVEAGGMEPWKGSLTLQVGQTAVVDAALNVSGVSTAVQVQGDVTPLVTTTSPTLATVVERTRIEQLPLNTRLIFNLIGSTTPGLEVTNSTQGYVKTFGLRYATEYLQDGALVENRDSGFIGLRPPGIDTIEEFRVETNNSSARMNRPATIITTTKAGTNQLHGSAFETARNNGIGVARSRTDFYTKPPQLIRNEFGVSLGGPVYVPKLYNGKNRTFFFFSHEALRLRSSSTRSITMPTAAMRQGDFSRLVNSQGRLFTLYDPWSTDSRTFARQPFPGNQIPLARQSPLYKYLNNITPLPTMPNENPLVSANWFGPGVSNQSNYTMSARLDHRISDRDQVFFRITHAPNSQIVTNSLSGGPIPLDGKSNAYNWKSQNDNGVVSYTHTFSPTLFSETVFNYMRDFWGQVPVGGLTDYDAILGLPNPFKRGGFPWIESTGFGMDYYPGINYTLNYAKVVNFDQNLTKIYGRHELQFGGRYRHELLDTLPDQLRVQGRVNFNSQATGLYDPASGSAYTAAPFTGHAAANFFIGVGTYDANFRRLWYNMVAKEKALYLQDNFKVNGRFTLNIGLRYEYNGPIEEKNDLLVGFNPKTKAIVVPGSLDSLLRAGAATPSIIAAYTRLGVTFETQEQAGIPKSFVEKNPFDFGPRIGFAWRTTDGNRPLVVRGGYSIFAFPEPLRLFNSQMVANIPGSATFQKNWNAAEQSPDGLPNYLLRAVPPAVAGVNSTNVIDADDTRSITRGSGSITYFKPKLPTARAHEWNFTLEREIAGDTSVKLGYVGTHGARLSQYYDPNGAPSAYVWYASTGLPLPTGEYAGVATRPFDKNVFGTIRQYQKTGWSNNQSFYVNVEHRYSKGYALQAYYMMSNALRAAGDGWRDDAIPAAGIYVPGTVPEDESQRNRLLNYKRDPQVPKHRFNYNWIVDLPFGKGKRFGGGAGRLLDAAIGGWQIAGSGTIVSNYFTLPTSNWAVGNVEIHGKKYPVEDCRSGVCYPGYLYWNGYIPANRINSRDASGRPNGVMGVPENYVPSNQPLIPTPKNGGSAADPMFPYYESNTVWVPLKNGTLQRVVYDNGLNPWRQQFVLGPVTYLLNASAFKTIRINERAFVRFNADFFNVLNLAGTPQPGSDGIIQMRNSSNPPRQLQLTMRLTW